MEQNFITDIIQGMLPYLNNAQYEKLQQVLQHALADYEIIQKQNAEKSEPEKLWHRFNSQAKIIPKKLKFLTL